MSDTLLDRMGEVANALLGVDVKLDDGHNAVQARIALAVIAVDELGLTAASVARYLNMARIDYYLHTGKAKRMPVVQNVLLPAMREAVGLEVVE